MDDLSTPDLAVPDLAMPDFSMADLALLPSSIYDIKTNVVAAQTLVTLVNRLVTARTDGGFFLQTAPNDADYDGTDYSGIFVVAPANTVKVGDRVTVSSAIVAAGPPIELVQATVVVVASLGEASPAPVAVTSADVATGGTRAAALESVIVSVNAAVVTDIAPAADPGDTTPTHEFVLDGSLRVNDELYAVAPFPVAGIHYASVTGILDLRFGDSKLEPRSASDVVAGAPILVGFGPALTFVNVGQSFTPSFPDVLTVTLSSAPATDTFVSITSGDVLSLTVDGGGVTVPAGQTTAPVLFDGLQQAAGVTLTATLGLMATASVRVLGAAETPTLASLTPATATIEAGGTQTFTTTLDIPAPAGGVVLSLGVVPGGAGSVAPTVTIHANQLSATFDYTDASTATSATVSATLGATTQTAALSIAPATCPGTDLVISEIRSRGAAGAADEFVELYNPTTSNVTLTNAWKLEARSNTTSTYSSRWVGSGVVIPAHGHFLVAGTGYTETPSADSALSSGITDASAVHLVHSGVVVDTVCFAFDAASMMPFTTDSTYGCEGTPATNPHNNATSTNTDASLERLPGGAAGNCSDTGDNATDFSVSMPANPQNSSSPATP